MSIYGKSTPYLQPTAYYSVLLQRYDMARQHAHHSCEIMYISSGEAIVETGESQYALSHGQYIFLDEDVPHSLKIDDPRGCSIMNIEFACLPQGGMGCLSAAREHCKTVRDFLSLGQPYFVADGQACFGGVMKDLIFQLESPPSPESRFLIGNLLERLVCALAEGSLHQNRLSGITYVRRAAAYIERHYAKPLKVPEIAEKSGVSRSYLQLVFQKEMGCSVGSYINRLRIGKAKFLLANTLMPLADIACQVGFNSRQNFVLAFQRETGITPSAFRKRNPAGFEVRTGSFKQFGP